MGALLHLALDIIFNGEYTPRSIGAFYSFGYRLAHGFDMQALLPSDRGAVPQNFWVAFFRGSLPPTAAPDLMLDFSRARTRSRG
jgi:hypothetical protein